MSFLAPIGSLFSGLFSGGAVAAHSIGGAAAIAAGEAIAAGATGAATTGLSSGLLTALQGGLGIASAISSISAANANADAMNVQATNADIQAVQEKASGLREQTSLKKELATVLGGIDASTAAAGVDVTSGLAENARATTVNDATAELSISRADSEYRQAMTRAQAAGLRARASQTRQMGFLNAFGDVAKVGVSLLQRR